MKKKKFHFSVDGKLVCKYFNQEDGEQWLIQMRLKHSDVSELNEMWKFIPNFGRYKASNYGRIGSINYKNSGCFKIIKPAAGKDGYLQSMFLKDDGTYNTIKVHKLIALAFLGARPDGTEVNHINGDKQDNNVSNLEYISHSANCQHSFDTGLQKPKRGILNGMCKITQEQVDNARKCKKESTKRYWGRKEMAKEMGISEKHLQRLVNKENSW
jgi:hypothetical protein